jgi:hypothetical protein
MAPQTHSLSGGAEVGRARVVEDGGAGVDVISDRLLSAISGRLLGADRSFERIVARTGCDVFTASWTLRMQQATISISR